MTGDVIRHLWPISLVLLPEAISRDAWRLLRFRRQSPIHCKSFDIFLSPELQHSKYLKKGYQVEWKIKKEKVGSYRNNMLRKRGKDLPKGFSSTAGDSQPTRSYIITFT
jgi:hypothetical protein